MAGAGAAIALLSINVISTVKNVQRLNDNTRSLAQTYETIAHLEMVVSLAKDAETGQRGFVITGNPDYLEPYNQATADLEQVIEQVAQQIETDAQQQALLPTLRDRVKRKLSNMEVNIGLRQTAGFEAAQQMVMTGQGKAAMDAIRATVNEMVQLEQERLPVRSQEADRAYRTAILTGLISGLLALAALTAFLIALRKYLNARDHAATTIAAQAENLKITLTSIGDGVITTDAQGRVTNLNPVAEALTGWTIAEAMSQPLEQVFQIVNESSRESVPNPAFRALAEGTIVGLANHTVLIAKDGIERPIDDNAAPIRDRSGEVIGCVLVFRDVSDRQRQERQLRAEQKRLAESEQRFLQIADTMPQIVWVTRPDGYHEYYNRRWYDYIGCTPEECLGTGWNAPLHPEDQQKAVDLWSHSLRTGEPYEIEYRFRSYAGEYRWFLGRALPVRDDTGQITRWFGTCTDIEDFKQAEAERNQLAADLSEADRRKDEFLATLAHELRNPLAPIRNGLQILQRINSSSSNGTGNGNGSGSETIERIQAMMVRQLTQMVQLIDELMDVSRISRGKVTLRPEPVEVSAIIEQAVEACRPDVEAAQQVLSVTLPPQSVYLQADSMRLVQVFSNLLNNASKYSETGAEISLNAEQSDRSFTVSIKDTGIGISAEMLPRIFNLFTQVEGAFERASGTAATAAQGGLGIGLTLVKQLVDMHEGSVQAYSAGLGRGSEFVVQLPTIAPPDQAADSSESNLLASNMRRILIVDDNEDSALTLTMLFEMTGDQTQTAHDGLQAIETAAAFRPDVALLDIGLPGLNGYEVAQHIRQQPWGESMILVALTGWGQIEDREKSSAAGFNAHMVKPVDHDALLALLQELMDGRLNR